MPRLRRLVMLVLGNAAVFEALFALLEVGVWKEYSWPFCEGHLAEMVDLLHRRGIRLAIVIFPFEPQIQYGRTMRDRRDEILAPQQHLERLCGKYAVPCLDLYPAYGRAYAGGRTLYLDGIHPNQESHTLTADEVLRFLDPEWL